MVAATQITVAPVEGLEATNAQSAFAELTGKAGYAAEAAGQAQGQAGWAADKVGFLEYHLREVAALIGHPMPAPE